MKLFKIVTYFFNNAGVLGPAPLSQVNREMYDWLININLGGCFNGVHAFLPKMQSSNEEGHIIATCSTSGFIAYPMLGLYSASKFGIRGLMTSLRAELTDSNVDVSIVCPGEVTTNIVNSTFDSPNQEVKSKHQKIQRWIQKLCSRLQQKMRKILSNISSRSCASYFCWN